MRGLPGVVPTVAAGAYQVPRPSQPVDLWLDGNEGPAPAPAVLLALAGLDVEQLRRYPDASELVADLAETHGVEAEEVVVLAGADEALDRFCRAFGTAGRNLVVLCPAFEMTIRYAELSGVEIREVWWTGGEFPLDQVLAAVDDATCGISLASPNNPTGLVIGTAQLVELARRAPATWLVADLVYAGFLDVDPTPELLAEPNVLVLHSLSKSRGLAGLRIGFALGPVAAIAAMARAGGPYSVAGPSLVVARVGLRLGVDLVYRRQIERERRALTEQLRAAGAEVPESCANFVLATLPRASWLFAGLAGLGIAVRQFPGRPGLEQSLRITCPGRVELAQRLLAALRAVLNPEAILFDLDGVLADVSGSYRQAIVATAAEFGVRVLAADIAAAKSAGDANNDWVLTHRLIEAGLAGAGGTVEMPDLATVTRRFESIYQGGLWRRESLLVSAGWLQRLARRARLGIVTGRPRADAERFLRSFGLRQLFPVLVCMGDTAAKPAAAPVLLALRLLGASAAWMLGDTVDDVVAARAAGVVPIAVVAPGEDPAAAQRTLSRAGAARVLNQTEELLELL